MEYLSDMLNGLVRDVVSQPNTSYSLQMAGFYPKTRVKNLNILIYLLLLYTLAVSYIKLSTVRTVRNRG